MKKIITLLAIVCFAHIARANGGASQLSLRLFDNAPFAITFDNQHYANQSSTYKFQQLIPGHHFIRVTKMQQYGFGWGSYSMPVNVFEGWIDIPAASDINAMITNFNQYTVINMQPIYYGNNTGYGNWGYNFGIAPNDFQALKSSVSNQSFDDSRLTIAKQGIVGGVNADQVAELMKLMSYESTKLDFAKYAYPKTVDRQNYFKVNNAFGYSSSIDELATYIAGSGLGVNGNGYNTGNGWNTGTGAYGNGNGNWGYNTGIAPNDFQALKNSVSKQSFDDSKLTIAKQGIAAGISADQVAELMKLMSYDSTKLDFAKYAYKKTVDKQSYFKVNDAFTYGSSVDELAKYIGTI